MKNIPLLVDKAREIYGGNERFWQQYYEHLSYELSEHEQQGLAFYHHSLCELGIDIKPFSLQLWSPHATWNTSPAK
jgi:predicted solute-binding protein